MDMKYFILNKTYNHRFKHLKKNIFTNDVTSYSAESLSTILIHAVFIFQPPYNQTNFGLSVNHASLH